MFKKLFRICIKFNLTSIIAFVYYLKTTGFSKKKGKRFRLLALNHNRFIQDLKLLEKTGEFKIYKLPFDWQSRFLNHFYNREDRSRIGFKEINKVKQKIFRAFLKDFLFKYYRFLKVNCVIGASIHYRQDIDWGVVSAKIGIPYIVLHKECLYASEGFIKQFKIAMDHREKFNGTHAFVHNTVVKKTWLESNLIKKSNISVGGCMRMDAFIHTKKNIKKKFDLVFFSFAPGFPGLGGDISVNIFPEKNFPGFHNLSEKTHLEVILFAKNNPNLKVLIKPKWGGKWIKFIYDIAIKNGIEIEKIKNLKIDEKLNTHDVINSSKVFLGFNSSVLLEAAIKNKLVIIPIFEEALKKEYKEYIFFRPYLKYFKVANSKNKLSKIIKEGLSNNKSFSKTLKYRKQLFSDYISPISKKSVNFYKEKIKEIISKNSIYSEKR